MLVAGVAAVLICAFFVVDFFTARYFVTRNTSEQLLMALLVGLAIGQVNLIAVWTSLAPGNIVLRVSWSLLLTMAMWYGLILGTRLDLRWLTGSIGPYWRATMTREDAIFLIAILLAGVAILQIPLWIAKKVFRWRLTRQPGDTEASLQEDRQFNLRHLLIAMFLLAVALSPLRHILPAPDPGRFRLQGQMFVLLGMVILCNLVMAIPCIWWAFASTKATVGFFLGWLLYCAVLTAIEFGSLCAALGPPPRNETPKFAFVFYIINLSQCAAVLGTLWILRAIGFRMVRTPRPGRSVGTSPFRSIVETERP
jgi:hypothetical protein